MVVVLCGKMMFWIIFSMFIRWTIPRFRFDQLMSLAWQVFIPLALLNLIFVMVVKHFGLPEILLLPVSLVLLVGSGALALRGPRTPGQKLVVWRGHERVTIAAP
jgi:NADH-quinone oxidoreductase subunit H